MIGWLRKVFSPLPRDREISRLKRRHARRAARVPVTIEKAHEVSARIIGEAFHEADGAAFGRRTPVRHA